MLIAMAAITGAWPLCWTKPSICRAREPAKLVPHDSALDDRFGTSVAIDGDVLTVGARFDDDTGEDAGAAYVFRRVVDDWIEQAKLIASDAAARSRFGQSVSVSGDTILVGAPRTNDVGTDSGAAYVFRFVEDEWIEEYKLTQPDPAALDRFGVSVSVSGNVAVVGSRWDDDACPLDPDCNCGSAYVFRRVGTLWSYEAKLTASDATGGAEFGYAVSIDGARIVVGAYLDNAACPNDPDCESGAAYVFQSDGSSWTQVAKLTASDADMPDRFGVSVSVEGETVVVGAERNSDAGEFSGSAYVFQRPEGGWVDTTETTKLVASDAQGADRFGVSVSIRDGVVLVGARNEDSQGSNAGAAYVYRHDGLHWAEQAKLSTSDSESGDRLGVAVAVGGEKALVGAPQEDSACPDLPDCNSGAAYVFDVSFGEFDLRDCARLQRCFVGPGNGASAPVDCLFDFDLDTDVDLGDWRAFIEHLHGP
jgi:hypothetical protein